MFVLEPLIAKLLLPMLGGTPNVWNTCMVFFQTALLGGYLYAHLSTARLTVKQQWWLHSVLLCLALCFLPIKIDHSVAPPAGLEPAVWLLCILCAVIGAPFLVLSASAPLLQKWYSQLQTAGSSDPYFLYAASNLGSLLGLAAYPFLIEPNWTLAEQAHLWQIGYIVLALASFACGALASSALSQRKARDEASLADPLSLPGEELQPPAFQRQCSWILWTALPSSLVLGLTTYITSELAAIPLFWMVPLALYLLSFILVFSRPPARLMSAIGLVMPAFVLITLALLSSSVAVERNAEGIANVTNFLVLHLATLFLVACVCHGKVAKDRPNAAFLTGYFLLISLGGVLGSMFNALLAPVVFTRPIEYPLALGLVLVLTTDWIRLPGKVLAHRLPPGVLAMAVAGLTAWFISADKFLVTATAQDSDPFMRMLLDMLFRYALPFLLLTKLAPSKVEFRQGLVAMLLVGIIAFWNADPTTVLYKRNFFGTLAVRVFRERNFIELWNGVTRHGRQSLDPDRRWEELSYYANSSPIGEVITHVLGNDRQAPWAVVGLGAGALAGYASPGEPLTFYEINPQVLEVASDPLYFTFLFSANKRGAKITNLLGDARIRLNEADDAAYKLLVIDAFSSDSIPLHLITREALHLYFSKIRKDGFLAFHVTNGYYDLLPVLARLVVEEKGWALQKFDAELTAEGKDPSHWVIISKNPDILLPFMDLGWAALPEPATRAWTDDYANPLSVMKQKLW